MADHRFTERAVAVLDAAEQAAVQRRHSYVGTEHILIGLLQQQDDPAAAVVQNLVPPHRIAAALDTVMVPGEATTTDVRSTSYTSRGQKLLGLAMKEAERMQQERGDTTHLLLALCADEKGLAGKVLREAGVTRPAVKAELRRVTGSV